MSLAANPLPSIMFMPPFVPPTVLEGVTSLPLVGLHATGGLCTCQLEGHVPWNLWSVRSGGGPAPPRSPKQGGRTLKGENVHPKAHSSFRSKAASPGPGVGCGGGGRGVVLKGEDENLFLKLTKFPGRRNSTSQDQTLSYVPLNHLLKLPQASSGNGTRI